MTRALGDGYPAVELEALGKANERGFVRVRRFRPAVGELLETDGRHVVTPDFLRAFSASPRFRVIK